MVGASSTWGASSSTSSTWSAASSTSSTWSPASTCEVSTFAGGFIASCISNSGFSTCTGSRATGAIAWSRGTIIGLPGFIAGFLGAGAFVFFAAGFFFVTFLVDFLGARFLVVLVAFFFIVVFLALDFFFGALGLLVVFFAAFRLTTRFLVVLRLVAFRFATRALVVLDAF